MRVDPRFLLLALLLAACNPEPAEPAFPDQETPTPPAEEDPEAPWDGLSPKGLLAGVAVDAVSGEPLADEPVTELGIDKLTEANTLPDGTFIVEPQVWEPAQFLVWGEGRRLSSVAVTTSSYLGIGEPVKIESWTEEAGATWVQDTFGMEWLDGVAIVVLQFTTPAPEEAEGLSATISSETVGSWAFDSNDQAVTATTLVEAPARPWLVFLGVVGDSTTIEVTPNPGMVCSGATSVLTPVNSVVFVPYSCEGE